MLDEMEDKDKYYWSMPHKYWCDLMSTMEGKYNRKRDMAQKSMDAYLKSKNPSASHRPLR